MRTIGVRGSDETFNAVIDHFDVDGDGEMRYEPLVDEVVKGSRHWLEHPSTADVREENKRRMANGEGGNGKSAIVNLELAKVMLKNSPGLKGYDQLQSPYSSARSSTLSSARSSILSTARKSARSTSGRSSARSTSRGESREVIESLQRQLQEERKRREEVEKELEDERKKRAEAGSSAAAGGDSKISQSQEEKEEKGGAKGEDEELRKFKAFKSQGGVVR